MKKFEPLHPARLEHPLERALREEIERHLKCQRNFDILCGPTLSEYPGDAVDCEQCQLTGGWRTFPYGRMTPRDKFVLTEFMQFLGSPVGLNLLRRAFSEAGGEVIWAEPKGKNPNL